MSVNLIALVKIGAMLLCGSALADQKTGSRNLSWLTSRKGANDEKV